MRRQTDRQTDIIYKNHIKIAYKQTQDRKQNTHTHNQTIEKQK